MELNEQQKKGLDIAVKRYRDKKPYTILAGPAGTGKTFTVKYIIKELGLDPEKDVAYCAYTGRAAQVLRNHGNPGAMTTHKLLYKSREMPMGRICTLHGRRLSKTTSSLCAMRLVCFQRAFGS